MNEDQVERLIREVRGVGCAVVAVFAALGGLSIMLFLLFGYR